MRTLPTHAVLLSCRANYTTPSGEHYLSLLPSRPAKYYHAIPYHSSVYTISFSFMENCKICRVSYSKCGNNFLTGTERGN